MTSTFTIGAVVATFNERITGSGQEIGDVEKITLTATFLTLQEWADAVALVTTKYHIHTPLTGANVIIDVVRGAGVGALVVPTLGSTSALLIECRRTEYFNLPKTLAQLVFLRTAVWA